MSARKAGRPARNAVVVTPGSVMAEALDILDRDGADALTMRDLAARLGVNPMTIYHHFGDRNGLIKSIAEMTYAEVVAPKTGDVRRRIEKLLLSYHRQVVQHPALTLSIFGNSEVFPDQAKRISEILVVLLREFGLSASKARVWLHILVDFTHGSGLASAMHEVEARTNGDAGSGTNGYPKALKTLLDGLATAGRP